MTRQLDPSHSALRLLLIGALLILPGIASGQSDSSGLTGNLRHDISIGLEESKDEHGTLSMFPANTPSKKSVILAGGLSALLPGTGQLYAEAPLWRTILYGAIEVAGWTAYGIFTAKGDQATRDFETYADRHWDVTRYISWIADNYTKWSSDDVDRQAAAEALAAIYISDDPSLPPWGRIDFAQLNKLERAVKGGFSHTLPPHGHQQYYEEIGKYIQYRSGWDDHMREGDSLIYNPSRVSPRNQDYVGQREDANALLGYATTALGVVVLNHLVSMVDAALEARSYNVSVRSDFRGEILPDGRRGLTAQIGLSFSF